MLNAYIMNTYIMNTQRGIVVTGQFQLSLSLHRDYAETLMGLTFYKFMTAFLRTEFP